MQLRAKRKTPSTSIKDVTSKAMRRKRRQPHLLTNPLISNPARIMGSFLETKEITKLLATSRGVRTLFSKSLTPILLQACVNGERDKVHAILTQFPELLHEKGTVIDYSGRVHRNRTVYQLALGACDYNYTLDGRVMVDGMVEMIEEHFKRLTMPGNFVAQRMQFIEQEKAAGKISKDKAKKEIKNLKTCPELYYINKVMHDQYDGQFPHGYEAKEAERVNQDREAYHKFMKVIEATSDTHVTHTFLLEDKIHNIIRTEESGLADELRRLVSEMMKAPLNEFVNKFELLKKFLIAQDGFIDQDDVFDFELLKALYQFRNHLEPKEEHTFGKHFNSQLLADVAEFFYGDSESPKNKFCLIKILGYVERFTPACDAQVLAQGVWSVLENQTKSKRKLKFTYEDKSYYPLSNDAEGEMGYNFVLINGRREVNVQSNIYVMFTMTQWFKGYFENKCIPPLKPTHKASDYERKPVASYVRSG